MTQDNGAVHDNIEPANDPRHPSNPTPSEPSNPVEPTQPPLVAGQTLSSDEIKALADKCSNAYGAFMETVRALPVQDVYKQMAFQLADSGWLWVKEGIARAIIDTQTQAAPTPAPSVQ